MKTSEQKMEEKLNSMDCQQLFDILLAIQSKDDEASFIIYDKATDALMAKASEEDFEKSMLELERLTIESYK